MDKDILLSIIKEEKENLIKKSYEHSIWNEHSLFEECKTKITLIDIMINKIISNKKICDKEISNLLLDLNLKED